MQPNNQNPYYPPRQPMQPTVAPSGGTPNFKLPKSGMPWGWISATIISILLLIGIAVFAFWAFGQRQDYKNNFDKKAAAVAENAKKEQSAVDDRRFAEELKNPLKSYVGPESYGSVSVQYPKTWSGYVTTGSSSSGSTVLDAYFNPDVVPNINASSGTRSAVALRVQVVNQPYNQVVSSNKSYIDSGKLSATPYALPKMPEQIGMKLTGTLSEKLNGTQIIIPLRDKTLLISTDTDQFLADFNNYILPNLTFVP
jgi:hypothetical protein